MNAMRGKTEPSQNTRDPLNLKMPEPIVSTAQPWADDVLDRQQLSARLTNLIRTQTSPFTVSIHGNWGTGKTFLLKRWQKDLEDQTFNAIYFNSWEDDFCSDPLLAMLGQLAHYFKGSTFHDLTKRIADAAIPLLRQNILGVLNKSTGLTLDLEPAMKDTMIDEYLKQRATKDELKELLSCLSEQVFHNTERPLIFIIDELDRCRPTFATELLERVKHIFDIPHMVFVFGINRDELCKSFQSEYGQINADAYLRRFFDVELMLPDVDIEVYARHVMDKFNLNDFFSSLSTEVKSRVHAEEFRALYDHLPRICAGLDLSLRDIDYCVGSIAMVGKNIEKRNYMYPWALAVLIPLKLKNPALYRKFTHSKCSASEIIDYLDESFSSQKPNDGIVRRLDRIEAFLYFAENAHNLATASVPTPVTQLELLENGSNLSAPRLLSKRIKSANQSTVQNMLEFIQVLQNEYWADNFDIIGYVSGLIDLHQKELRR